MITFNQVTYTYPGAGRPALQNITLDIFEGEFTLVIGPSGAGKSTLLRCVNGLVPHFSGGVLQGDIAVNGLNPVQATPQVLSRQVGFVFQDPEAQFVMDRVEDEIAFALENAAMPPQEMRIRVEETLDLLDLAPLRRRPLETLSGGERQRVAIASALAFRPQVLVLDEPTSQLDPKSAEDVLQALVRLNSDLGLTILLAEHRLERVLPFIDRVVYLPAGDGALLVGHPRQVLPQTALTPPLVALGQALEWKPLPLTIKEGRVFSRRWLQEKQGKQGEQGEQGERGKEDAVKPTVVPTRSGQPYLETRRIKVEYDGQPILHGLDLQLWPGEVAALMGRNGAGKTTVLKSLAGLIRPRRGQVIVAGRDIASQETAAVCRQVGYLPQDPNALLFAETVLDELKITLRNHGLLANDKPAASLPIDPETLLARLGLAGKAAAYPRDLSAGERQRVALAAVTVTRPGALLLDEPTRGLDYPAKHSLADLLHAWRDEGLAILLATHDVELAAAVADRVMLMSQGEIIADGDPGRVLGASPLFAPQIARLFPQTGWLTVEDVVGD